MTPVARSRRPSSAFRPLAIGALRLGACLITLAWPARSSRAEDAPAPVKIPTEGGDDGGLLHPIAPTTAPASPTTRPTAQPTTAPSTQPTTKPSIKVSPEVRAELDALRDAYKALTALHLAGTISAELDINGDQRSAKVPFEAEYEFGPDGAPRFRQVIHDSDDGNTVDKVVGCTGDKLYYFDPEYLHYRSATATKKKFAAGKMPRPYYNLLAEQDPSLLLAVVEDASAEVLEGLTSIEKVEDIKIGDESCPVLRMVDPSGDTTDLVIDPKTHLVRRSISDQQKSLKKSSQPEVKKAVVTIDYAESTPQTSSQTSAKPEQFAWAPPEGAHEVTATADGAEIAMGPPSEPADALVSKPAPDFKLKGMTGQEVSLAALKGNVIVLDFWATWCGPCRESLPHLNKLYEQKKGAGLKMFAVDLKEEQDDVRRGIDEMKLTIPVLLDSEGKVAELYLVEGIPQTVVIGKDGLVKKVFVGVGPGSHEEVVKAVEEAMK